MTDLYLTTLLEMRLLVGYLGERSQFAWWPTMFYDSSSRLFLEPVFSKTSKMAQYHGVLEAARRLHDEHLSVGTYHLFRLPEEIEQDLHTLVQSESGKLGEQAHRGKEVALEALQRLATPSTGILNVGPTAMGNIIDIDSAATLRAIADAYLSAFSHNAKTYPYLME
jgi:hypothetical protein